MSETIEVDAVAAQIHQFYCDLSRREGWSNDFAMPFSDLPEFMKEDNRQAARRIGRVLALAGLRLVPRGAQRWTESEREDIRDLIEQNIELLAEGEHDGFVEARLRQGWRLGPYKDIPLRMSHLLVGYARFLDQVAKKQEHDRKQGRPPKLSVAEEVEREKLKDRDGVRNYLRIVVKTKYRIAREES